MVINIQILTPKRHREVQRGHVMMSAKPWVKRCCKAGHFWEISVLGVDPLLHRQ